MKQPYHAIVQGILIGAIAVTLFPAPFGGKLVVFVFAPSLLCLHVRTYRS